MFVVLIQCPLLLLWVNTSAMTISVVMGYLYSKCTVSVVDHCPSKISDSSYGPASIQLLYRIQFCYVCCLEFHVLWADAYVIYSVVVAVVSKTPLKLHVCCCETMFNQTRQIVLANMCHITHVPKHASTQILIHMYINIYIYIYVTEGNLQPDSMILQWASALPNYVLACLLL